MTWRHRRALVCAAALVVLTHAGAAAAQTRGAITGLVSDVRGTVLARINVKVRQTETGTEREAVTAPDGTFQIGGLLPGEYEITVEDFGFTPFRTRVRLAAGATEKVTISLGYTVDDFSPVTDRWRLQFPQWQRYPADQEGEYPFVPNRRRLNPYDQNVLKGDLPVIGDDIFFILTAIAETPFEYRKLPTPSGVSAEREGAYEFFGQGEGYGTLATGIVSFELFKGSTTFKPRDWAVRVTPAFNVNYVNLRERNALDISPGHERTRRRHDLALQEAFGEVKLFDVGPDYDFVSVRGGIQPFTSDFRGFLYRDTNLGVRAFGNWGRNRNQWNLAYFDQLEKETNSELNESFRRNQQVFIANYYRQDFLTLGYTVSPSFHANLDRGDELFYDHNGFLIRPAPIGLVRPHEVKAYYLGVGGDGHIGRLNVTHQYYFAFGEDEFNGIASQPVDIKAHFAAVEFSIDKDWWRPRASFVYASGDGDPDDDKGTGFDAILDNPNIAGGPFSFWQRQGLRLAQTAVGIKGRSSVLPSLRSSKVEGQANFVNPGLLLLNVGWDAELTPTLRTTVNLNAIALDKVDTLQRVLFQGDIDRFLGVDAGFGVQWRPWLTDNLLITAGASVFQPGKGFKQVLNSGLLYSPFVVATLTY
jgi:hypothetical protein